MKVKLLIALLFFGNSQIINAKSDCIRQNDGSYLACIIPKDQINQLKPDVTLFCAKKQEDGPPELSKRNEATFCRKFIRKVNTGFLVQDFYTTGQKYTNEFMITQSDWLGMVDMPTDCKVPVEGSLIYYSKKGKKQAIYRFKNSRYYSGWNSKCD
ncbi:hypothetical protein [Acinetobacter sp. MB5]|uniref:hypothetical protein n=1 Tax=Acinetobacter sp. MB5 TaxID=2069438 RepID=UPI000DD03143|nr:hypothetical protein [Acinetobacter sp. MB5]